MRLYSVHLPAAAGSGEQALDRAEFVRDGFHASAFLLSVLWCLWRGLWLPALAILALAAALFGIGHVLQAPPWTQFLALLVLALLIGLEAANLRRFGLRRQGYVEAGVVAAGDRAEAEGIFFARSAQAPHPAPAPAPPPAGPVSRSGPAAEEVVGLFPEYRGR